MIWPESQVRGLLKTPPLFIGNIGFWSACICRSNGLEKDFVLDFIGHLTEIPPYSPKYFETKYDLRGLHSAVWFDDECHAEPNEVIALPTFHPALGYNICGLLVRTADGVSARLGLIELNEFLIPGRLAATKGSWHKLAENQEFYWRYVVLR